MAMKTVRWSAALFEGAVSLERGDGWVKPWRLPHGQLGLCSPGNDLGARAERTAGVRLYFQTDATALTLEIVPLNVHRKFDLTIDGELIRTVLVEPNGQQAVFEGLPGGDKIVELWLPADQPVSIRGLRIERSARFSRPADRRPRWIAYGSSITHCGGAHSPARTWPATVARARRLNLTCLGYGGNCHLEPMVARMIRDLPADFISMKVGINIQGGSTLSPRTFRPAIIGFVQILREKHRRIPIAVVSPIVSPPRETQPNAVGLSLTLMREQVQDAVRRLADAGDGNIHYFDGLQIFGADLVEKCLPDKLHPNGDGYELLGRNFLNVVMSRIPL